MDQLSFVRNHMISYVFELLRDKSEQEQLLLRLLVNKLVHLPLNCYLILGRWKQENRCQGILLLVAARICSSANEINYPS